ncbi:MAG TPA: VWA domain-containing protein [Bryobacteraceae bacterium]|jgi:Ca-activated chloride channel family protein|nr:VWA domain-containing protein [Bryobacteraceae bacterium]
MHLRSNLFFASAFLGAIAFAQTPPPAQDDPAIFTSDTKLVPLHVSVIDKNGKLITNLPQSAFKVFENNVEQPLKIFNREDVPVSMGIIIDNSGSMREKRPKVAAAALELIKDSNPQDEVFIVDFNDVAYLDAPFTNNVKKLEQVLDKIDTRGGTAMRDAISMSIDYAKENGKKSKKVLLVITDGNDNTSNETLEQLIRKAHQSEVLIYCIGLLSEEEPREARAAKRALNELSSISGGLSYYPKTLSEVETITPQIAHEIRNQYILAYTPLNSALDGTFRAIKVTVKAPGNPTVRTRNGYFATPVPAVKPAKGTGPGDK